MRRIIIVHALMFMFNALAGQGRKPESFNRYNSSNKKDGYWKVYFDEKLNLTDSVNSYFFGYQLYDNGEKLYMYGNYKQKRKLMLKQSTPLSKKGQPVLLDGKFDWMEKKSSAIVLEEKYENGLPKSYKRYDQRTRTDNSWVIIEFVDFSKPCTSDVGSFTNTIYFLYSPETRSVCYKKEGKSWRFSQIK